MLIIGILWHATVTKVSLQSKERYIPVSYFWLISVKRFVIFVIIFVSLFCMYFRSRNDSDVDERMIGDPEFGSIFFKTAQGFGGL